LNYDVTGWNALFAPVNTPQAIVDRLNKGIAEVLAMPDVKKRILDLGTEPRGTTPQELGALLRNDIKKWGDVIARAGLQKR
jgi:tripartite-type tricarboxylate transporter receptor subunit TctC